MLRLEKMIVVAMEFDIHHLSPRENGVTALLQFEILGLSLGAEKCGDGVEGKLEYPGLR